MCEFFPFSQKSQLPAWTIFKWWQMSTNQFSVHIFSEVWALRDLLYFCIEGSKKKIEINKHFSFESRRRSHQLWGYYYQNRDYIFDVMYILWWVWRIYKVVTLLRGDRMRRCVTETSQRHYHWHCAGNLQKKWVDTIENETSVCRLGHWILFLFPS